MLIFADLDSNNVVIGVKNVRDDYVNDGSSIPLMEYDESLLGKTYNNGVFL